MANAPLVPAADPRGGVLRMLAASMGFAAMALCISLAHRREPGLSTHMSSFVRAVVNTLALLPLAGFDRRRLLGDGRMALWVRGLSGGAALGTYFAALPRIGMGEAAFLNQTSAVWVAALAPSVLGEPSRAVVWIAIAASLVGMGLLGHPREGGSDAVGRLLGAVSGLAAASAYLSVRRASQSNGPVAIVFYFTFTASLISGGLAWLSGASLPGDAVTAALLVAAGLLATVAQLWMTEAYRRAPAALASATAAAGPFLSTLLGIGFLGQVPDALGWVGMGVLGVAAIAIPLLTGAAQAPKSASPPPS